MYSEKLIKKRVLDFNEFNKDYKAKNEFYIKDLKEESSKIKFNETNEGYHFELKKPGYIKEDFNFFISKKGLVVTTEKMKNVYENQSIEHKKNKHSYCYPSAYFKMAFHIPNDTDKDEFFYDYKDGILSFDLKKPSQK
jgi:HSP20 family molecular chaperone IbpA